MSKPTSVPGLGRLGRALFRIFSLVVLAPTASPGLAAPMTAAPVFIVDRAVDPLTVVTFDPAGSDVGVAMD